MKNSLKIRMEQMEANALWEIKRWQNQTKRMKELKTMWNISLEKTTDLENRSRRDNLKIMGLSESHDQKKSLDIIFHEIIKENCPDILEPEGKINTERIHQSPPERDTKRKTPRNVAAKSQRSQVKEKILQAARKKQLEYCGI